MAFSYKVRVALALEASARLSSLLLLIVSSTFRSLYDRTHVHLHLTLLLEWGKIMRPHETMSVRNAQLHSNDVFSTNEMPFLILGHFFKTSCFCAIAPLMYLG